MPNIDEASINKAVAAADLNVMRMALYQATRDKSLLDMTVERKVVRGGASTQVMLADEFEDTVISKATAYLKGPREVSQEPLTDAELKTMMESFTGEPLTDKEFAYRHNFVSLKDYQFEATWSGDRPEMPDEFKVVVIGAGFSGVAVGVQLERLGIPYVIYERRHEIGGTWSVNTYPDARVDTSSFTYQFTFEKNYPWSEFYARQHEVRSYLESVARRLGVFDKIVFNTELHRAAFDDSANRWDLTLKEGDKPEEVISANVLISGAGLFGVAKELDLPGVESFGGSVVHTTAWPPEGGVAGKRVAIVGNGSTGVQLLSSIAEEAEHVDVYQRTPQWIAPREGYGDPVSDELRLLLDEMPFFWNWYCYLMFSIPVRTQALHEYDPEWQKSGGLISERNDLVRSVLTKYIKDSVDNRADLYEHLIPKHPPFARRLIVDNKWYKTLLEPNVDLVPQAVESFTSDGIRATDGVERPVDVVVAAVGFSVSKYLWPVEYVGPGGVTLEDVWDKGSGPMAYLGMTIPEFPNLFVLYGPNSQARTGSLPSWIEIWSRYVAQSVVQLIESGKSRMSVRKDVFDEYNEELDDAARQLVWDDATSRTRNYYVHASGRQQVNAPWNVDEYYERVSAPNPDDFVFE